MKHRGAARSGAAWLFAAAAAFVLAAFASPLVALAADPPPDPDSACSREKSFKSTAGVNRATLTIINNTDQPVQSFWLDYRGKRVFYRRLTAHNQYKQATWLTHPWIVAGLDGTCYRLTVMTSLEQTVTVNPGTGGTIATAQPVPTVTPIGTTSASAPAAVTPAPILTPAPVPTAAPVATVAPLPDPGVSSGTGSNPPDYSLPLVLGAGALAAVGAAVAAYWAAHTGRYWWGTDDARPPTPPKPAPDGATDTQLHYTDNYYDQYGRPIADEQVFVYEAATYAWKAAGSPGLPPKPPTGNPDLPVSELVAQHEVERRAALAQDSTSALFIKDASGNFYDASGRPIPSAQMDTFWKGYEAWQANGRQGPYPEIPTGDPFQPINEKIAKVESDRRAKAADERDPAYIQVRYPKPF